MKVKTLDEIESMHQWLDDKAVLRSVTIKFQEGVVLDSHTLGARVETNEGILIARMPEEEHVKWFNRLIDQGFASEDLEAELNEHPANEVESERLVPHDTELTPSQWDELED